jgi:hypothetical protein
MSRYSGLDSYGSNNTLKKCFEETCPASPSSRLIYGNKEGIQYQNQRRVDDPSSSATAPLAPAIVQAKALLLEPREGEAPEDEEEDFP